MNKPIMMLNGKKISKEGLLKKKVSWLIPVEGVTTSFTGKVTYIDDKDPDCVFLYMLGEDCNLPLQHMGNRISYHTKMKSNYVLLL